MTGQPEISPESCQRCAYPLAGMLRVSGGGEDREPVEGDLIICPACGAVWVAEGIGYRVRWPSPAEVREILADPDVIERVAAIELAKDRALNIGRERRRREARGRRPR